MIRMKISVNNPLLEELLYALKATATDNLLPKTRDAMEKGAGKIQNVWQNYALGKERLPDVAALKNPSGKYAESIKTEPAGSFAYEIYSEAAIAERIENGTHELDMKRTHLFGPKSRVSKEGFPYVIIPLRWKTPKTIGFKKVMPVNIYNKVKEFKKIETLVGADKSLVKTQNYSGEMVGRAQYNRGYDKLNDTSSGNMNGMVRSTDETGIDQSGGYFTFRIISAKQLVTKPYSWIRPATPAYNVTRGLKEYTEDEIGMMVEDAIMEDFGL